MRLNFPSSAFHFPQISIVRYLQSELTIQKPCPLLCLINTIPEIQFHNRIIQITRKPNPSQIRHTKQSSKLINLTKHPRHPSHQPPQNTNIQQRSPGISLSKEQGCPQ